MNEKKDASSPKGVIEACLNNGFDCSNLNTSNSKTSFQWSKIFKQAEIMSLKRLASLAPPITITVPKITTKGKSTTMSGKNPVLTNIHNLRSHEHCILSKALCTFRKKYPKNTKC